MVSILLLSSCGFHPLYKEDSQEIKHHLTHIKIQTIPNREGQILHNQLSTLLTPHGAAAHPLYTLSTTLIFATRGVAIQKDATASQEAVDLTFKIILTDFKTGDVLYSTSETLSVDYVVSFTAPYSNLVEEKSAKRRLVDEAAQSIRLHLASFFSKSKSSQPLKINEALA
jgi:hypothetical protein